MFRCLMCAYVRFYVCVKRMEAEKLSNEVSFQLSFIFNSFSCNIDLNKLMTKVQYFPYHLDSISLRFSFICKKAKILYLMLYHL